MHCDMEVGGMKRSRARWLGAALAAGAIAGGAVAAEAGAAPVVDAGTGVPPVVASVTQITPPAPNVWAIPPPFTPGTTTSSSAPYTVSILNTDPLGYTVSASSTDGALGPPPATLRPELHLVSPTDTSRLKPFGGTISAVGSFATPAPLPGASAVGGRPPASAPVAADLWTFEGRVAIDLLHAGPLNVGMDITVVPGF
jgi:hypothetical protein